MRSPPGPGLPTSELYRLTPPWQQPSQLREALDAAYGIGGPNVVLVDLTLPHQPWWRELAAKARLASRRALGWGWRLATTVLAGALVALISAYLRSGH